MTKREKCAAAGRYVRQIQREHLREVAKGLKNQLTAAVSTLEGLDMDEMRAALEAVRRLGL